MKQGQKNYKKIFFLTFLLFGLLVEIITLGINFGMNYFSMKEQTKQKFNIESAKKVYFIESIVSNSRNSIQGILDNKIFQDYLKNIKKNQDIKNLFRFIMEENKNYMQLRYLDISGKEIIRLDRLDGKVVNIEKLQDKSKRYYFQETIKTKENVFWHSDIDLNIENGKIEIPHNPTFRVAKKVYFKDKLKGIVIINIKMDDVLDRLIKSYNFDVHLIDDEGFMVYSSYKDQSWAKQLKKPYNFLKENGISKESFLKNNHESNGIFYRDLAPIFLQTKNYYLVFKDNDVLVHDIKKSNFYATLWVMIFVFALSIPLALVIANIPTKLYAELKNSYSKIKEFSKIADSYIMSISTDDEDNIIEASTAFVEKSGYNKEEIIGKKHNEIISNPSIENKNSLENGEMLVKSNYNDYFWVEQSVFETKNENANYHTSMLFDISDKKRIEEQSLTDYLTAIQNRKSIDRYLEKQLSSSQRYNTTFSVFMLDIDDFKKINDTYGHVAGDKILQQLSFLLKNNLRTSDTVGRFGGEEFLAILPHTELDNAVHACQGLREIVENHNFYKDIKVTASFGVTTYKKGDDITSIVKRADEAMYEAKNNGKNRVEYKS